MTPEYLDMFIDETRQHLRAFSDSMIEMERTQDPSAIAVLFRAAHTIKGMAMTMDFTQMGNLTHQAESVLDGVRTGQLEISHELIDALLQTLDTLEAILDQIERTGAEGTVDVASTLAQLAFVRTGGGDQSTTGATAPAIAASSVTHHHLAYEDHVRTAIATALSQGLHVYEVQVSLAATCQMKAARCFILFAALGGQDHLLVTDPPMQRIEQEDFADKIAFIVWSEETVISFRETIERVPEISIAQLLEWDETGLSESQATSVDTPTAAEKEASTAARKHTHAVRVDTSKLDELMNLVSECAAYKTHLEQISLQVNHAELSDTVTQLSHLSSALQSLLLSIRMVPVEAVFQRFPRMVRDTALRLGKEVDFITTGWDTHLDRTVIEEIGDPIMHMLRNSLDHGLEPTEERIRVGKSPAGRIELSAYTSGNDVFIEVADDGRGIDRERVLQKAVERGLISPGQPLRDHEVDRLLFAPGFSTAEAVSDLSGRGVGLDVVHSKIESLSGKIEIHSKFGVGTRFVIRLPLTLAVTDGLLVRIGALPYVIPINSIVETNRVGTLYEDHGRIFTLWRERNVPVVLVRSVFHEGDRTPSPYLVIVQQGDDIIALAVDDLLGQTEVVVKPLDAYLKVIPYYAGATILADGQVALILDVHSFFQ
ncbi:MAG: chemotaxis protein CheA [Firmicutes bacterium]|nr:chemotaxis protein CheA [Bacillota bacterium]